MPKNTIVGLLIAYGAGLVGGLLTLLVVSALFSGYFVNDPDDFLRAQSFCIIIGIVESFSCPFFLCLGFLLPLAAIDKNKIEELPFTGLVKRYAPIITLPLGFLFCFSLFGNFGEGDGRYSLMVIVLTFFGICFSSFWFFLRKLKA